MNEQTRKVVQQAIEALEQWITPRWAGTGVDKANAAHAALQQLLEAKPAQEPVAVVTATNHLDGRVKWLTPFSQGLPLGTEFYTTAPAQPAAPAIPEWLPIETAPKTSKAILVYCEDRKNTYVVSWGKVGGFFQSDGWRHFGGLGGEMTEAPTRWMPLPAAPTGDKLTPLKKKAPK